MSSQIYIIMTDYSICEAFTPSCSEVKFRDEECLYILPYANPRIVRLDDVQWGVSNWMFESLTGDCGKSFVNSGNVISCFELNSNNVCVASFANNADNVQFIHVYISDVDQDVTLMRQPNHEVAQLHQSNLALKLIKTNDNNVMMEVELESGDRCTAYPEWFDDVKDNRWQRVSTEAVCDVSVSAIYSRSVTTSEFIIQPYNQTHHAFLYQIGGVNSKCNGIRHCVPSELYAQYYIEKPVHVITPQAAVDVLLITTLIPFFTIVLMHVMYAMYDKMKCNCAKKQSDGT